MSPPGHSGHGGGGRQSSHSLGSLRSAEARELEERRASLTNVYRFAFLCWPAFFLLDLYVVLVVQPGTPLLPFVIVRVAVLVAVQAMYAFLIDRLTTMARFLFFQVFSFGSVSAGIGVMALYCGGITSRYSHGLSIVLLVHAAMIPAHWRRGIWMLALDCVPYLLVVFGAALVMAHARGVLPSQGELAYFGLDFTFVVATLVMGAIASHVLWSARRQVHEARKLGRYRLKVRIGVGGMGEVWMAWDDAAQRDVALKVLSPAASEQAGAVARFEREARAAASLRSPHTVRVLDYGASDDGVRYLAMELLEGVDLADVVVRDGPLSPSRAVRLVKQACASLAEAHANGIVHRDIKPANLFLTAGEDAREILKVVDFGIAKVSSPDDDATLTQAGWIGGTPAYMAPEVCAGLQAEPRSDVYSLGASLFFLLTGEPPFEGSNAGALMTAHLNARPVAPSRRAPWISADLDAVVLRCLAKGAADRFATVGELEEALAACDVDAWQERKANRVGETQRVA